jgi:enoyl-CoA hydratase/carnithine racemase
VATVEIRRGPNNFFDLDVLTALADRLDELAPGPTRAVVLCSEGKHFCAGADFTARAGSVARAGAPHLYDVAIRLFDQPLPIVALTVTLPPAIGQQAALDLLYTGRRVDGETAHRIGLCDHLVPADRVRERALEVAGEIAASAPLATRAIRATMRGPLAAAARAAMARERAEQERLQVTEDFREGVAAMDDRRPPRFTGR